MPVLVADRHIEREHVLLSSRAELALPPRQPAAQRNREADTSSCLKFAASFIPDCCASPAVIVIIWR